ncbi:hypothetical protein RCH06_001539 [Polaromonas sp. CG_9.5]|nr:hypothetical protein [Polaromonas sp. CG_9.5]
MTVGFSRAFEYPPFDPWRGSTRTMANPQAIVLKDYSPVNSGKD